MKLLTENDTVKVAGGAMNVYEALGPEYQQALMSLGIDPQHLLLETLDATVAAGAFAEATGMPADAFYKVAAIAFADGMEFGMHHPFPGGPV